MKFAVLSPGRLTDSDIAMVAAELSCSKAAVLAVREVEASGSGFLPDNRPKLLFEAHVFYRLTHGRFGVSNISSPSWNRSLYGAAGAHQYDRLAKAIELDRAAALKSASWGMFQILGENYKSAGYDDVESFVQGMVASEGHQLRAFSAFCRINNLARYLREPPNFAAFARGYNGSGYAANAYDTKLAEAYRKNSVKVAEAPTYDLYLCAKQMQTALQKLGLYTAEIDGKWGTQSRAAYNKFNGKV